MTWLKSLIISRIKSNFSMGLNHANQLTKFPFKNLLLGAQVKSNNDEYTVSRKVKKGVAQTKRKNKM